MSSEGLNTLIAGCKDSGKTFASNWHLRRDLRVLAYDRTGYLHERGPRRFDRFDGVVTEDPKLFKAIVNEGLSTDTGYRVARVDRQGNAEGGFLQDVYQVTEPPRPGQWPKHAVTVWFEEAHKTFARREIIPPILAEMMRGARHRRTHFLFTSTKANDLPLELRELIDDALIFRHSHAKTLDYIADLMGHRDWREKVRVLPKQYYYLLSATGEVTGPHHIRV